MLTGNRQAQTDGQSHCERQTDRQRERDKHTDRHTYKHTFDTYLYQLLSEAVAFARFND